MIIDGQTQGSGKTKVQVQCDYCGKILDKTWKARNRGNEKLDKDACFDCRYKKREEVCLLEHGVKNHAQRPDIKLSDIDWEKHKNTISKLHMKGYSQSYISEYIDVPRASLQRKMSEWNMKEVATLQQKKEKTCLEKYGKDYYQQQKDKRTKTNLEKYGVENPFESEKVKNKIKETNMKKYGVAYPMQNVNIRDKSIAVVKEKYGVDNIFQNQDIKNKAYNTNLKKYGYKFATKNSKVKQKMLDTKIKNGQIRIFDNKTCKELAQDTGYCLSRFNQLVREYGFEIACNMDKSESYSSLEKIFSSWLDNNNIKYISQYRIKKNKKLYIADFYLQEHNVLIELDGLYWHSEVGIENKNYNPKMYHFDKREFYINRGFKCLFFREDEIRNNFHIIQSIVLHKTGQSKRLYARNCDINIIKTKESGNFCKYNHLMGSGSGMSFGLMHNNVLSSILRLRNLGHDNYEISRFCHLLNTTVVGGLSKLLKYIEKELKPKSITTFIDQRYGMGNYLKNIGFEMITCYPSFKWTNGYDTYNRLKFPAQSGYKKGLVKIWDCGQAKYVKEYI